MKSVIRLLSLWALLLVAQQGAVVHELGHLSGSKEFASTLETGSIERACASCSTFAQATAPAVSHTFHIPLLTRIAPDPIAAPLFAAIDRSVPLARSRGPPV